MNERLTELYRASKPKEALASQDEFKSANSLLGSDVEKFAELIIRECAQYIEDKFDFCGDELVIAEKLKEHFGVE